ncbi:MAG: KEOPS complex subunit Cgi121, partial [Candidatus Thorarchaeota archaeon]|nr:KEOPS complex subunit Cgi121 [Candidatus Thorarchaeota archaeon]
MMHLDRLISEENTHSIGIAEFRNENDLGRDKLISLAQQEDERLLAIQLFDASKIVDFNHLLSASQNAVNAWHGGYSKARSLDVETAVYASTQRQINRALDSVGVSDGLERIAVVVIGDDDRAVRDCLDSFEISIGSMIPTPFPANLDRLKALMSLYGIE